MGEGRNDRKAGRADRRTDLRRRQKDEESGSVRVDCEESLFCSKIREEERKKN